MSGIKDEHKSLFHADLDPMLKLELETATIKDDRNLIQRIFPDKALPASAAKLFAHLVKKGLYSETHERWDYGDHDFSNRSVPLGTHERELSELFNKLGKGMTSCKGITRKIPREWTSKFSDTPVPRLGKSGAWAARKPDLFLSRKPQDQKNWSTALATAEHRSYEDLPGLMNQLANAAFMTYSAQGGRRFFIGLAISITQLRLIVHDRSGRVQSQSFNFDEEPELLVRVMAGLMLGPDDLVGLDPTIKKHGNSTFVSVNKVKYKIEEYLWVSDSVRGRGTACWKVSHKGVEYVIKDTWVDTSRKFSEVDILEMAKDIPGVPRVADFEIMSARNPANPRTSRMDSTLYIREDCDDPDIEIREHWRVVFREVGTSLLNFSSKKELLGGFIDAIETHRRLVEDKNLLHRDISLYNIMLCDPETFLNSGTVQNDRDTLSDEEKEDKTLPAPRRGLLIDLDFALVMDDAEAHESAIGHRTGTLPYMAIEILLDRHVEHMAHHDLESFFFVLLWICINYVGPGNALRQNFVFRDSVAAPWVYSGTMNAMGQAKLVSMAPRMWQSQVAPLITRYFTPLIPFLVKLRDRLFGAGAVVNVTHAEILAMFREEWETLPYRELWTPGKDLVGYGLLTKEEAQARKLAKTNKPVESTGVEKKLGKRKAPMEGIPEEETVLESTHDLTTRMSAPSKLATAAPRTNGRQASGEAVAKRSRN